MYYFTLFPPAWRALSELVTILYKSPLIDKYDRQIEKIKINGFF